MTETDRTVAGSPQYEILERMYEKQTADRFFASIESLEQSHPEVVTIALSLLDSVLAMSTLGVIRGEHRAHDRRVCDLCAAVIGSVK